MSHPMGSYTSHRMGYRSATDESHISHVWMRDFGHMGRRIGYRWVIDESLIGYGLHYRCVIMLHVGQTLFHVGQTLFLVGQTLFLVGQTLFNVSKNYYIWVKHYYMCVKRFYMWIKHYYISSLSRKTYMSNYAFITLLHEWVDRGQMHQLEKLLRV